MSKKCLLCLTIEKLSIKNIKKGLYLDSVNVTLIKYMRNILRNNRTKTKICPIMMWWIVSKHISFGRIKIVDCWRYGRCFRV